MKVQRTESLQIVIAALLVFLFVYTASSKLFEFATFQSVLSRSPLIEHNRKLIGWTIPLAELFTSALLLFPSTRQVGFYFSLALLSAFTLYIGYMMLFVSHLPCACGGVISKLGWKGHLAFNLCVMAFCIYGIILRKTSVSDESTNKLKSYSHEYS